MGLPWRFISANAGIVTFVMEGSRGEEFALPGKFVKLMLSPVPLRLHKMRPEPKQVYASDPVRHTPLDAVKPVAAHYLQQCFLL